MAPLELTCTLFDRREFSDEMHRNFAFTLPRQSEMAYVFTVIAVNECNVNEEEAIEGRNPKIHSVPSIITQRRAVLLTW